MQDAAVQPSPVAEPFEDPFRPGGGRGDASLTLSSPPTAPGGPWPIGVEWLLTNGMGGFAMGTALGVPTRRYHALLIATQCPPTERVTLLRAVDECLIIGGEDGGDAVSLRPLPFHFAGGRSRAIDADPAHGHAVRTVRGPSEVAWEHTWTVGGRPVRLVRVLHLFERENRIALRMRVEADGRPWRLELRPLVTLRDFHRLLTTHEAQDRFGTRVVRDGGGDAAVVVASREAGVLLMSRPGAFVEEPSLWRGLEYVREAERGLDCAEAAWCPGVFVFGGEAGSGPSDLELQASAEATWSHPIAPDGEARRVRLERAGERVVSFVRGARASGWTPLSTHAAPGGGGEGIRLDAEVEGWLRSLAASADDYVVRRAGAADEGRAGVTVIAGYPWFADWGRDTTISLPGLFIATGRLDEARSALETFARHRRRGLIPNRFDDYARAAHFNTADAPLWFVHACHAYMIAGGDRGAIGSELLPAVRDILSWYRRGTDGPIGMDPEDGLIAAGTPASQLTWMDARRDGVSFTPRHGKAVEINALWHNALVAAAAMAEACPEPAPGEADEFERETPDAWRALADRVRSSFVSAFVRRDGLGLYDRLEPRERPSGGRRGSEPLSALGPTPERVRYRFEDVDGWMSVDEVRPNQIFAVSLPFAPLAQGDAAARAVVDVVRDRLLTPVGLRTLDAGHPLYRARYAGSMFERDRAYHNGTVWPWLIGPFCEAELRVDGATSATVARLIDRLRPLLEHRGVHCPGHIAEVFNPEPNPVTGRHRPDGCPAQAWSTAEVLRVLVLAACAG